MSKVKLKIKDIAKVTNGKSDVKNAVKNGEYVFFDRSILTKRSNRYLFDTEAIIIPGEDSRCIFEPRYFKGKFDLHQRCYVIYNFKDGYDAKYLFYKLKTHTKHFANVFVGSTVPSLRLEHLTDLKIAFPTHNNQQKIASVLSTLDSKIELNNRINAELEEMAKILYDYWFVQFDFPDENGKPYKTSGGEMVWSEELKREIPKGWEVENLKDNSLTNLIKPRINFFEGQKIYLATADVSNNDINFDASKITFENRESRANMQPISNSVWFAKMKNTKKVLYFGEYSNYFLEEFILSTGFAGIQCEEKYYLEYVWGFVNHQQFEIIKDRLSNGATQEAINNDSMAFIPLIIPNENALKEYHKKTFDIYKKIYLNKIENQKLAELRDFLLPMLMNGQVAVEYGNICSNQ